MLEQESAKTGKIFTGCSDPLSQSIGCGRISRVGLVDRLLFAKVENGVTKFSLEGKKTESHAIFHFSEQDCLLFARVKIGVTKFPTKTSEKDKQKWLVIFE